MDIKGKLSKEFIEKNKKSNEFCSEIYKMVNYIKNKYNYINMDEDVIQDVVLSVYQKINQYDSKRGSFSTFVFQITKSIYFMYLRENKKNIKIVQLDNFSSEDDNLTFQDFCASSIPNPYDQLIIDIDNEILKEVKPTLSKETIMFLNGYKQREIAIECGITQSAVSQKIKKELKGLNKQCALTQHIFRKVHKNIA